MAVIIFGEWEGGVPREGGGLRGSVMFYFVTSVISAWIVHLVTNHRAHT